jgi:hypothetical protein
MSQTCPRCGLFNPPEAARCDCGYDFVTGQVEASYLTSYLLEKHGGKAAVFSQAYRANMQEGAALLVGAALASLMSCFTGDGDYWAGAFAAGGAVLLARGLRRRRRGVIDARMLKDLSGRP